MELTNKSKNDLIIIDDVLLKEISFASKTDPAVIDKIVSNLPEIKRGTALFSKTQSEFMDTVLTVSHPTPIRNLRQILSETERCMMALREAYHNHAEKEVELKIQQRDALLEDDELKRELLNVKIRRTVSGLEEGQKYINASLKKVAHYQDQYNAIMKAHNLENYSEEMFEAEEEKYHIMKCFDQALCAMRARGGSRGAIDEGNFIYLSQVGINGTVAQGYIAGHLQKLEQLASRGEMPTKQHDLDFLEDMAQLFKGCSQAMKEHKGMLL